MEFKPEHSRKRNARGVLYTHTIIRDEKGRRVLSYTAKTDAQALKRLPKILKSLAEKLAVYFLIIVCASSCSRYSCQPPKGSPDYAQVISAEPISGQRFKTVLRWDNTGNYDTLNLYEFYKVGSCFQKCERVKKS